MEKILVIIIPQCMKTSAIEFACSIAHLTGSGLTGVFVQDQSFELIPSPEPNEKPVSTESVAGEESGQQTVVMDAARGILLFFEICRKAGVAFTTCECTGEPVEDVVYESRYADLLIIDPEITFNPKKEKIPTHFVKEVLANAECPSIVTPNLSESIHEIFFCYDASKSSIFAIKQFTYLLPQFNDRKVVLLEINPSGKEQFNEGHKRIMNWLKMHYSSVGFQALEGDVKEEMFSYFFMKRNILIVMGAYGRGLLPHYFYSTADKLVRTVDLPLFITHY